MSADDDIVVAVVDLVVDFVESLVGIGVGVETGDFGVWKETVHFVFDGFGAEAFVMNAGIVALWARSRDGEAAAASMAMHFEFVGMKDEWQETVVTKRLPAALIANGERRGTAAIVKYEALGVILK